jgi:hypothetical protein
MAQDFMVVSLPAEVLQWVGRAVVLEGAVRLVVVIPAVVLLAAGAPVAVVLTEVARQVAGRLVVEGLAEGVDTVVVVLEAAVAAVAAVTGSPNVDFQSALPGLAYPRVCTWGFGLSIAAPTLGIKQQSAL